MHLLSLKWNTLVILDWLTKKARLNSKRTIDACKNTINRRLQSLWKDSYRNRKIFVWICLKAVEFAFEINRPLKITIGQRFCGHHFSRKFSYLYFYSVRYVYIRGRSQTTFTNFANFWPPTYLCLHWLTFRLPPTYLSTLKCDIFLPYIDMY